MLENGRGYLIYKKSAHNYSQNLMLEENTTIEPLTLGINLVSTNPIVKGYSSFRYLQESRAKKFKA